MSSDELAAMGIEPGQLPSLSQKEIEDKLDNSCPRLINECKLLDIYTKWLSTQVSKLGYNSCLDTSLTIRRGCDFLSARKYDKGVVIGAFWRHREAYIRDHPEGKREFNFAKRDIEINYSKFRAPGFTSSIAPSPQEGYPSSTRPVKELNHPLHVPVIPQSDSQGSRTTLDEAKHDLVLRERLEKKRSKNNMTSTPSVSPKGVPPSSYLCKRCGVPGHYIQNCKTNGNPNFDCPPPKGYICRLCGEAETHFISACPRSNSSGPAESNGNRSHKGSAPLRTKLNYTPRPKQKSQSGSIKQLTSSPITTAYLQDPRDCIRESRDLSCERGNRYMSPARPSNARYDHMSEERARYIESHTDRYRPTDRYLPSRSASPEVRRGVIGRGPQRSGSNADPIVRRPRLDTYRQLDSYRPDPSTIKEPSHPARKSVENNSTANSQQPKLPYRSKKEDSDGRLSPWGDMQPPVKKRHREESPDVRGLPRDEIETSPPKKRLRDNAEVDVLVVQKPSLEVLDQVQTSTADGFDETMMDEDSADPNVAESDIMDQEDFIPLSPAVKYEDVKAEAGSFLDMFEWELSLTMDSTNFFYSQSTGVGDRAVEEKESTNSGSGVTDQQKLTSAGKMISSPDHTSDNQHMESPRSPASSDILAPVLGENEIHTLMVDIPEDMAYSRHSSCDIATHLDHCGKIIQPLQTLKPLWRDPPYDRCVLELFRGREHSHVYVNVLRRITAIDMYEDDEAMQSARRMLYLKAY